MRAVSLGGVMATLFLASAALAEKADGAGADARPGPVSVAASSDQYAPETPEQEASRLFRRGVELFDQGNVQEALVQFLRSHESRASVAALRNASLCLTELGRHDEALDKLERALKLPDATGEQLAEITAERDRLEAALGTLEVTSAVLAARVFVDQRERGTTPLPRLRLSEGEHYVRVEKDGHVAFETVVSIVAGETQTLEAALEPLPEKLAASVSPRSRSVAPLTLDSSPRRPENGEEHSSSLRTWSWASLGAGTALVTVAVGAYAVRRNDLHELQRSCEKMSGSGGEYNCASASPDRLQNLRKRAERVDTLSTVVVTTTGLGAAALLLGGVGLWYTAGDERREGPSAGIGLWLTGTQAGVAGRF